jgi:thiamine biosynthesis lipoprotein
MGQRLLPRQSTDHWSDRPLWFIRGGHLKMDTFTNHIHVASGEVMGGAWQVRFVPRPDVPLDAVVDAALAALQGVDQQMSNYRSDSDLMRVNAAPLGTWVQVPDNMHHVMSTADRYARLSDGALNIALGRLVNQWGFGPEATPSTRPDMATTTAEAALVALGSYALRANPPTIYKTEDVMFDLCALAKGFAVDQAARAIKALGINDFLIEAAGEIFAQGHQGQGKPWTVGLELPVPLDGVAVATSGGYRNLRQIDGTAVSHTIDPKSGQPLTGELLSVTVLHAQCMHADALATVLYVLGAEKGPRFAADNDVAALFLMREPKGIREVRSEHFVAMTR